MWSKHVAVVLAFAFAAATVEAQPLIHFKSRELHEGRNFIKSQIAVPEVAEASGQLTYSYPAGRFEQHFHGLRGDEVVVAGARGYDSEIGGWLSRDYAHRDPQTVLEDIRLVNGYGFVASNPYADRDPSGLGPDDTQIVYVRVDDVVKTKGGVEYRWTLAAEAQRKEYEAALGKFLIDKGVIKKGVNTEFHEINTLNDVSTLANKDFGAVVFLVHGIDKNPDIAAILPNPAAGTQGDHQSGSQFANTIAGSSWTKITVLGCDTVVNGFSANLAVNLPKGGTVSGYSGNALKIQKGMDFSKTPGLLVVKNLHLEGGKSLGLKSFATGPKATSTTPKTAKP